MKRTRLSPESERHRSERETRRDVIMAVHARDRYCVAETLWPEITCGGPLDVDEIVPRSAWMQGYLDPANCQVLCRRHHEAKHHIDPRRARALGLLQSPRRGEC